MGVCNMGDLNPTVRDEMVRVMRDEPFGLTDADVGGKTLDELADAIFDAIKQSIIDQLLDK